MILVDVNLLLYAINRSAPQHTRAKAWWERRLSGDGMVGLPWLVILGFLRISTSRRVLPSPLRPEQSLDLIGEWLDRPNVRTVEPGPDHWLRLEALLRALGTAGNLTSDAHLAALALEYACELHSTDNDFARFPGVRWVNPLAERR